MEEYNIEPYNEPFKDQYQKEEAYLRAKKKLEKLVGFYWHLAVYIIINIFLIILIGFNRDDGESFWDFSTFATAFFWGIGLVFHFLGVFGKNFVFGKSWEERKMKEYLDKDREAYKRYQ